jgi:hypothetical protein
VSGLLKNDAQRQFGEGENKKGNVRGAEVMEGVYLSVSVKVYSCKSRARGS